MLDDSNSMSGQLFQNAKDGTVACIKEIERNPNAKVSVIIFNHKARLIVRNLKLINNSQRQLLKGDGQVLKKLSNVPQLRSNKLTIRNSNSIVNKYYRIVILFYTDGGDFYREKEIKSFCELPDSTKKIISLRAFTEQYQSVSLNQITDTLKPHFLRAECRNSIQTSALEKIWTDIVYDKYCKLRC